MNYFKILVTVTVNVAIFLSMHPTFAQIDDDDDDERTPMISSQFSECITPENTKGTCLPLLKCQEIQDYISSAARGNALKNWSFLKKRTCGFGKFCCSLKEEEVKSPLETPIPSMDECGIGFGINIANGHFFEHGEHPWLVGLGYRLEDDRFMVICGGTLITKRHVLTAAHCFPSRTGRNLPRFRRQLQPTHVILGEHNLFKAEEYFTPLVVKILKRANPGYDNGTRLGDIELVTLDRDITFSAFIRPACLPLKEYAKYFDLENSELTYAGWGKTDFRDLEGTKVPLKATGPLQPEEECMQAYDFKREVITALRDSVLCIAGDSDTCMGDSGGPLIYRENNMYFRDFVVGVTSFGERCSEKRVGLPGIYTSVSAYLDWILNSLKKSEIEPVPSHRPPYH